MVAFPSLWLSSEDDSHVRDGIEYPVPERRPARLTRANLARHAVMMNNQKAIRRRAGRRIPQSGSSQRPSPHPHLSGTPVDSVRDPRRCHEPAADKMAGSGCIHRCSMTPPRPRPPTGYGDARQCTAPRAHEAVGPKALTWLVQLVGMRRGFNLLADSRGFSCLYERSSDLLPPGCPQPPEIYHQLRPRMGRTLGACLGKLQLWQRATVG